jgi:hypothetical protein
MAYIALGATVKADPVACANLPWYCATPFAGFIFSACLNARAICGTDLPTVVGESIGQTVRATVAGATGEEPDSEQPASPLVWLLAGVAGVSLLLAMRR